MPSSSGFLLLPERPHELIGQGLHEIGDDVALSGLDKGLNRHARDEFQVSKPYNLIFRHGDPDSIERRARLLILRYVG